MCRSPEQPSPRHGVVPPTPTSLGLGRCTGLHGASQPLAVHVEWARKGEQLGKWCEMWAQGKSRRLPGHVVEAGLGVRLGERSVM